jgi:hypothetical protein
LHHDFVGFSDVSVAKTRTPNKSLQATRDGRFSSAFAGDGFSSRAPELDTLGIIRAMRKAIHFIAGITALAGVNIGFIKILIFLYHQWGGIGVAVGFTFLPPIFICPIWEWVATGHYMTFVLVYILGFGGLGLCKYIGD